MFQIVFIVVVFLLLAASIFTVKQQTAVIIERFGKFHSIRHAGFHMRIPILDRIAGKMSLKIQQLDVFVETKTNDNVFVGLKVSVQYQIIRESIYDAFYKLENSHDQITSYVFDTVRAEVPKLKLDYVFERKDDIAVAIKRELSEAMEVYGFRMIKALVTDIDPDKEVKIAMNKINAAERQKIAAEFEGEAEKIKIVAKANAEAESKKLQGQGIANQRREIARGLEESVAVLNNAGISSQEASSLILITQHYDTLQAIGERNGSSLILMPNSPNAAADLMTNMITSLSAANKAGEMMEENNKKV